jgi:hypothetical protein
MKIKPRGKTELKRQIAEATRLLDELRKENDPVLAPLIRKGEDMIAVAKVELQILDKLDGIVVAVAKLEGK